MKWFNNIPEWVLGIIGLAVFLLIAVLGIWGQACDIGKILRKRKVSGLHF
jgi:hypothetical protein